MSEQLMNNVKITLVRAGEAAGTHKVPTEMIDMAGFEGVVFFGTIATKGNGNFIYAQQDEAEDGSFSVDLAGSKVVATANGQVVWLDIYKPEKRYLRAWINRETSTAFGDIYAIQYQGHKGLISNLSAVAGELIGKILISPDEGTI